MRKTKYYIAHNSESTFWITSFILLSIIGIWVYIFFESFKYSQFDWSEIRPEIRDTAMAVERNGEITGKMIGIDAHVSKNWQRREWLKTNATKLELNNLLDHPNTAVKITAYEAILRQPNSDKYTLLKKSLGDTTTIFYYQAGCVSLPYKLGEYLMTNVVPIAKNLPPLPDEYRSNIGLSENQINELNALYNNNNKAIK